MDTFQIPPTDNSLQQSALNLVVEPAVDHYSLLRSSTAEAVLLSSKNGWFEKCAASTRIAVEDSPTGDSEKSRRGSESTILIVAILIVVYYLAWHHTADICHAYPWIDGTLAWTEFKILLHTCSPLWSRRHTTGMILNRHCCFVRGSCVLAQGRVR